MDADGSLKKNARNTVKEEASDEDKDLTDHKPIIIKKHKGHAATLQPSSKKQKGELLYMILSTDQLSHHSGEHARHSRKHRLQVWAVIQPIQSFRHCRDDEPRSEHFFSYSLAYTHIEIPVHDFRLSEEEDTPEQSRDSEGLNEYSIILLVLLTFS